MTKTKDKAVSQEDMGGALMAWYAEAIKEFPDGLISQAQAAVILGVSRVALSRLVARGYVRAVYFPSQPDIVGISVGQDDPTWLKIVGWLGVKTGEKEMYSFPKACYVSFADIQRLWQSGEAKEKCKRDWNEVMAVIAHGGDPGRSAAAIKEELKPKRIRAEAERKKKGGEK